MEQCLYRIAKTQPPILDECVHNNAITSPAALYDADNSNAELDWFGTDMQWKPAA